MSFEKILTDLKKKKFAPVYWLEGEEPYFIDKIIDYAEHHILNDSEKEFNLSVFYGKDSAWADIVNACMRYPMFGEKQVVILKEAQQLNDITKLESYINNPLSSTIFLVGYKDKKLDARTKFAKTIKEKGELLSTKKIYESKMPEWINNLVAEFGLSISQKALILMIDNVGNDLNRVETEIKKLAISLGNRKNITEDDIEKYVGVSKEFNVFELQNALGKKDFNAALRIVEYFSKNKEAQSFLIIMLPSLYTFFSKVYQLFSISAKDEFSIASQIGVTPFFVKNYIQASHNYSFQEVEKVLLLLYEYNLKAIGINNASASHYELMKEFIVKILVKK